MEQQSEPTAHASVSELALTPFSRLPPLNAFGLGTTENAALAVPGAASAPATATMAAARVSSRDDIGSSCPSKSSPDKSYAAESAAVRGARGPDQDTASICSMFFV